MGFKDLLEESAAAPARCKVGRLLDLLDEDARAEADAAILKESGYSGANIAYALTKMTGEFIHPSTVNIHRGRGCKCHSQNI